jgi:hypothetical protein
VKSVHLNLKEHKCDVCGKAFGYSGSLFNHKRLVHSINADVKCGLCGISVGRKKELNKHIKVVHLNMKA